MSKIVAIAKLLGLSAALAGDVLNTLNLNTGLVGVWVHHGQYWWRQVHAPQGAVYHTREEVLAADLEPANPEGGSKPEDGKAADAIKTAEGGDAKTEETPEAAKAAPKTPKA